MKIRKELKIIFYSVFIIFFFIDMLVGSAFQLVYYEQFRLNDIKGMYHPLPLTNIISYNYQLNDLNNYSTFRPYMLYNEFFKIFILLEILFVFSLFYARRVHLD